jgi:hypothetical protein
MTMFVCWRYTLKEAAGDADRTPLDAIATDGSPKGVAWKYRRRL